MKKVVLFCSIVFLSSVSMFAQSSIMNKSEYTHLDINEEFDSWDTEYVDYYLAMVAGKSLYIENILIGDFSDDGQYFIFDGDDSIFIINSNYVEGSIARGINARYDGTGYSRIEFVQVKETGGIITQDSTRKLFAFQNKVTDDTDRAIGESSSRRVVYSWYDALPEIRTKTWDEVPVGVKVTVVLGYERNNDESSTIISDYRFEIQDLIRKYFSSKKRTDLTPANEDNLKIEIKDALNELLETDVIKDVRFLSLEVSE